MAGRHEILFTLQIKAQKLQADVATINSQGLLSIVGCQVTQQSGFIVAQFRQHGGQVEAAHKTQYKLHRVTLDLLAVALPYNFAQHRMMRVHR